MRILPILGLLAAFLLIKLSGNADLLEKYTMVGYREGDGSGFLGLTTILGYLIVFFFYWFKFNEWAGAGAAPKGFRPRPARHFTTWLRFLGWNSFYGLLMVGVYSVIVFFPDLIFRLLASFSDASTAVNAPIPILPALLKVFGRMPYPGELNGLDPVSPVDIAPYAVMITTVVWAGMRPFSEFERRFRLRLQERAAIPTEAKTLIETFESEMDSFVPEAKVIEEILKEQQGRLFEADDFNDSGETLWFLMARAQYLYHLLQKYNREPVFARLAERYDDEFMDVKAKMARLHVLAEQRIADINKTIHDEQISQPVDATHSATTNLQKTFHKETLKSAEQLLSEQLESATKFKRIYFQKQEKDLMNAVKETSEDIVRLIVCSVLAVARSTQHCRDLLKAFGLKQCNRIPRQLDTVVVTLIAGGALSITFFCSLIYYTIEKKFGTGNARIVPEDIDGVLYWAVTATLMHLLATVGGYFCQRTLEIGKARLQIGEMKARPLAVRAQVSEALWSATFGFSLNVFLLGALNAYGGTFETLNTLWWWAFVPTVTAFFAALYTQRVERSRYQLSWLVWAQGTATGLVSLLVFYLLFSDVLADVWLFGAYLTITTVILGLALSTILQQWVEGIEKPADKLGAPDQRKERRWRPLFRRAKWRSAKGEEWPARVLNVSSLGAELRMRTPLKVESEGVVKIIGREEQRARVVRKDHLDAHRIYVQFLGNAA